MLFSASSGPGLDTDESVPGDVADVPRASTSSDATSGVPDSQARPDDQARLMRWPCAHNKWVRIRKMRGECMLLKCQVCNARWTTRMDLHEKCPNFYAGACPGDCNRPHIYARGAFESKNPDHVSLRSLKSKRRHEQRQKDVSPAEEASPDPTSVANTADAVPTGSTLSSPYTPLPVSQQPVNFMQQSTMHPHPHPQMLVGVPTVAMAIAQHQPFPLQQQPMVLLLPQVPMLPQGGQAFPPYAVSLDGSPRTHAKPAQDAEEDVSPSTTQPPQLAGSVRSESDADEKDTQWLNSLGDEYARQ